ncbi:unnamed protein product [Clonostachys chloroleuca]|uniref:Uncharacterized protein n=1 Tax=Clonostachys chloroleuca TaxID=1926264 RepID=A0AA35M1L4_9HYPO|nr:unnamed protein product [Clonostachys chloroleuca]
MASGGGIMTEKGKLPDTTIKTITYSSPISLQAHIHKGGAQQMKLREDSAVPTSDLGNDVTHRVRMNEGIVRDKVNGSWVDGDVVNPGM